jgi:hypothetical protein
MHPAQVSGSKTGYKPSNGQYDIYNKTFGYLTVPPGYCAYGACHVFAAINDEFGCAPVHSPPTFPCRHPM